MGLTFRVLIMFETLRCEERIIYIFKKRFHAALTFSTRQSKIITIIFLLHEVQKKLDNLHEHAFLQLTMKWLWGVSCNTSNKCKRKITNLCHSGKVKSSQCFFYVREFAKKMYDSRTDVKMTFCDLLPQIDSSHIHQSLHRFSESDLKNWKNWKIKANKAHINSDTQTRIFSFQTLFI